MIYLKLEQRPAALAEFQKAVSLNDKFAPGHLNIGAMALSYRDYDAAEREFAKAVNLDPNSPEAHLDYAYALDGQRAFAGIEARPLGHRPALEDTVQFQSKVIVQLAGGVLLHDE